jgi:hypothetical protein
VDVILSRQLLLLLLLLLFAGRTQRSPSLPCMMQIQITKCIR